MDPFFVVIGGSVVILLAVMIMLGISYPGSGTEQLGWKSPREVAEQEAQRDSDDVAQMLEAANERRRARGEPELTVQRLLAEDPGPRDRG
jgi:hypothetical protein